MRLHAPYSVPLLIAIGAFPSLAQPYLAESLAPYVPTPYSVVEKMLEMAELKPGQTIYDLGSGDGRILIAAAKKYKVKGVGVEISPKLCHEAEENIAKEGLQDSIRMIQGNLLNVDLSGADVVTVYLLTGSNEKLKPKFERYLRAGTRIVSHDFEIRHWVPARTEKVEGTHRRVHTLYLYTMPPQKLDEP